MTDATKKLIDADALVLLIERVAAEYHKNDKIDMLTVATIYEMIDSMPDLSKELQDEITVDGVKFWFEKDDELFELVSYSTKYAVTWRYVYPKILAKIYAKAMGLRLPK